MMGVEATGRIRVQAAKCYGIHLQSALGLMRGSFEKRLDKRAEARTKVLENYDAVSNVG